jgi:hypothetical protein
MVYVLGTLNADVIIVQELSSLVLGSPLQNGVIGRVVCDQFTLLRTALLGGNGVVKTINSTDIFGWVVPGKQLNLDCPKCHPLFSSPNTVGRITFDTPAPVTLGGTLAIFGDNSSFSVIRFLGGVEVATNVVIYAPNISFALNETLQGSVSGTLPEYTWHLACNPWENKCSCDCDTQE